MQDWLNTVGCGDAAFFAYNLNDDTDYCINFVGEKPRIGPLWSYYTILHADNEILISTLEAKLISNENGVNYFQWNIVQSYKTTFENNSRDHKV